MGGRTCLAYAVRNTRACVGCGAHGAFDVQVHDEDSEVASREVCKASLILLSMSGCLPCRKIDDVSCRGGIHQDTLLNSIPTPLSCRSSVVQ